MLIALALRHWSWEDAQSIGTVRPGWASYSREADRVPDTPGSSSPAATDRSGAGDSSVSGRLTPLQELQLVDDFRAGDRDALSTLLTSYQRRVYSVCYRMLRDHELPPT